MSNPAALKNDERDLLAYLDALNARGIRFALSNVLESKGKSNDILKTWIAANEGRYRTIELDYNYSNSNYHTKRSGNVTKEVLVVNY